MNRFVLFITLLMTFLPGFAEADKPGSKDHPLVTRMQNMHIVTYRTNPFDKFSFRVGKGKDAVAVVEGRFCEIKYKINDKIEAPSPLAILRNHQAAFRAVGGSVMYEDNRYTTLKAAKGGMETWVQVDTAWSQGYMLTIVEKGAMAQEVVADATAMGESIKAEGKIAVYGITFDTGKAELKPESKPTLLEIAKMLKAQPNLKLHVVGHTDNVAGLDLNVKLSQARAEAVVQALVTQHGIPAMRLRGHGVGPLSPVASNDTEAGRAKNRRVELVNQ